MRWGVLPSQVAASSWLPSLVQDSVPTTTAAKDILLSQPNIGITLGADVIQHGVRRCSQLTFCVVTLHFRACQRRHGWRWCGSLLTCARKQSRKKGRTRNLCFFKNRIRMHLDARVRCCASFCSVHHRHVRCIIVIFGASPSYSVYHRHIRCFSVLFGASRMTSNNKVDNAFFFFQKQQIITRLVPDRTPPQPDKPARTSPRYASKRNAVSELKLKPRPVGARP